MTLASRIKKLCLLTVLVLGYGTLTAAHAGQALKPDSYMVNDITWTEKDGAWICQIRGNAQPAYTMYELFSPHRAILDIAYGFFADNVDLSMDYSNGPVSWIKSQAIADQDPFLARIELHLVGENAYTVNNSGNDILVTFTSTNGGGNLAQPDAEVVLSEVKIFDRGEKIEVFLQSSGPIHGYQSSEMPKEKNHPARLIVDLADVKTNGHAVPGNDDSPVSLVRTENYKGGTRVILDSASEELFPYSISARDNGLSVLVYQGTGDPTSVIAGITGLPQSSIARKMPVAPEKSSSPATASAVKKSIAVEKNDAAPTSDFAFAGYNEQKISVDFYKIDLHNVFRLIGEISGRNIVVAEGVSGSLTLSLNDVPWDFVLDVILNLKDLSKEERFNTIVISQKSKGFSWPERAEDKLAIKQEAISVTKRLDVPREQLEAKKVFRQAKDLVDSGNFKGALALYEKTFSAWPENGELAKRIANISLGALGLNAKAAHYGQIASRLLPEDTEVALLTALSLANMEKVQEAKGYFDMAVSGDKPSRHALSSYAAFSEQNESYPMALSILARYEEIYGTSLETMVSKARNYDKTGNIEKATEEYRNILLSGYSVPADLENYIKGRLKE